MNVVLNGALIHIVFMNLKKENLRKLIRKMNCEKCNNPMKLETIDDKDYWICKKCETGFLANPKKNCEHEDISFGVNNSAYCYDCGNQIAYS